VAIRFFENWNRFYDPVSGRYTAGDPVLLAANPSTPEVYGYAMNGPLVGTDATGLFPVSESPMVLMDGMTMSNTGAFEGVMAAIDQGQLGRPRSQDILSPRTPSTAGPDFVALEFFNWLVANFGSDVGYEWATSGYATQEGVAYEFPATLMTPHTTGLTLPPDGASMAFIAHNHPRSDPENGGPSLADQRTQARFNIPLYIWYVMGNQVRVYQPRGPRIERVTTAPMGRYVGPGPEW
jgi:hypothetical protein